MLKIAKEKQEELMRENPDLSPIDYVKANICDLRLGQRYDLVTSLFHIINYQVTNNDLDAYLETVAIHLNENGIAIIDFWYGPAVISDMPKVAVKRVEDENVQLTRITEPKMDANSNTVDVNFELIVQPMATNEVKVLKEKHVMRYSFIPELTFLVEKHGLTILDTFKWMTQDPLDFTSWNGVMIVKK